MRILAIDFSSERRSVAVCHGEKVAGQAAETGGRNTRAFALIEEALRQAGFNRDAIECVAVGLGPGSYTGIRAAIALAQGWQLARGLRLLGISSVEALAAQAQAASLHGQVHVLIDAQRNEFYGATYQIELNSLNLDSPLRLLTASQADSLADQGHLVGEPALRSRWPQLHPMSPEAAMLGRLAAHRTDFIAGEVLEPIYLRETNFVKAPPPRVPS